MILFFSLLLSFSCKPGDEKKEEGPKDAREIKMFEILKPDQTGISFQNELQESLSMKGIIDNYYYNGAGLAVGDFNNDGKRDIIPAYYNEGILYTWHGLMRSNFQLPFIKYRFQTYDAFGKATMDEIYGAENLQDAYKRIATNFATSYMENLGDGSFRIQALENLAQGRWNGKLLCSPCSQKWPIPGWRCEGCFTDPDG